MALLAWALVFAVGYQLLRRGATAASVTLGGLVVSHWLLDVLTHRPDMPVTIGGPLRLGLGLWNSVPATVGIEGLLFGLGALLYWRTTSPLDRAGRYGLWALVGFLVAVYVANLLGPPPPSGAAVAWVAQALWLLVAWGYWVDRHRQARAPGRTGLRATSRPGTVS